MTMLRELTWVGGLFIVLGSVHSLPNVKRRDELILYGNQQNQNHLSVKKSGPLPALGKFKESTPSDFEQELQNAAINEKADPSKNKAKPEGLQTVSDIEAELPHQDEQQTYEHVENELKEKMRQEKAEHHKNVAEEKRPEPNNNIPTPAEEKAELLKLKHMAKRREMERKRQIKRSKKSVGKSFRFRKARDELIRRSQEVSMTGATTLVRKKRDLEDIDPEELSRLGDYLAASRDGYYMEGEEPNDASKETDFYSIDAPRFDEYGPGLAVSRRSPQGEFMEEGDGGEEEDDEEEDDLVYYNIVHDGVPGVFIPYKQNTEGLLEAALNKADIIQERENIESLAERLAKNKQKRSYESDETYVYPVVEKRK